MEINKKLQRFLSLNKPFDSESSFQSLVLIPRLYRAGSKPFYVDTWFRLHQGVYQLGVNATAVPN